MRGQPVLCIDFDGVLLLRSGKFRAPHIIEGELVPGAHAAVRSLFGRYTIVIHTTRALTPEGRRAVKAWLVQRDFGGMFVSVTARKVWADAYIDDRAVRFEGDWASTLAAVRSCAPWTERRRAEAADVARQ